MVRVDTPGAKKLVSIKDLTRYSAAPVLRVVNQTVLNDHIMRICAWLYHAHVRMG